MLSALVHIISSILMSVVMWIIMDAASQFSNNQAQQH